MTASPDRPLRVAVAGAGAAGPELAAAAEEVGRRLAEAGAVLICGGLGGVMEAAARGCAGAGGLTIGILPGADADAANAHIRVPLPTGLGEARNTLVARTGDVLIAIGGSWGTLSEVALARKVGVPVVVLRPGLTRALELTAAETAEEAVRLALLAGGRP
ncbi:MAG: TIGR00725 family protein [Candidatus Longimicrobiales bacterium M2_2A_002]